MNMMRLFGEAWPRIEGDGLTLRKPELSDAVALLEMLGDEELYRFKPGEPHRNPTYAEHMVGWLERDYRKKKLMVLAIYDARRENRLVGTLDVFDADERVGSLRPCRKHYPSFKKVREATFFDTLGPAGRRAFVTLRSLVLDDGVSHLLEVV